MALPWCRLCPSLAASPVPVANGVLPPTRPAQQKPEWPSLAVFVRPDRLRAIPGVCLRPGAGPNAKGWNVDACFPAHRCIPREYVVPLFGRHKYGDAPEAATAARVSRFPLLLGFHLRPAVSWCLAVLLPLQLERRRAPNEPRGRFRHHGRTMGRGGDQKVEEASAPEGSTAAKEP